MQPSCVPFLFRPADAFGKPVCRLGLASRGWPESAITPDDVFHAVDRGVNFLNWPGFADEPGGADAMSAAIAAMGPRRESVAVCVQFGARTAADAAGELRSILAALHTDYVDVLTFYYVETAADWRSLIGPGGALEYDRAARRDGIIRSLGAHDVFTARLIARSTGAVLRVPAPSVPAQAICISPLLETRAGEPLAVRLETCCCPLMGLPL